VLSKPDAPPNEIKYSRMAEKIKHIVFSKTLNRVDPMAPESYDGGWKKNTTIVKGDVKDEMLRLKQEPGKNILLFGGASLAKSFIDLELVDEYRLIVNQMILSKGKRFFYNINEPHRLKLITGKVFSSGAAMLRYRAI
jgi:dihydrofolate reductase